MHSADRNNTPTEQSLQHVILEVCCPQPADYVHPQKEFCERFS
jgi:hypothetical protein